VIKVGLTGSIGSGKSMVASVLEHLGIPVYHADMEARKFLEMPKIVRRLTKIFGQEILDGTAKIDRKALAAIVFSRPSELRLLDEIIHPLVKTDFAEWIGLHKKSAYLVQEAAILFESGFDQYFNKIIVVTAPRDICISRVMKRDGTDATQVLERMNNQWDPALKELKADYVLVNDGIRMLLPQVLNMHSELMVECKM